MLFFSGAFLQKHLAKHTIRPFPGLSQPPLTVMMVVFIKANRKSSISWISCAASKKPKMSGETACTVMVSWYHPNCWLQNVRKVKLPTRSNKSMKLRQPSFPLPSHLLPSYPRFRRAITPAVFQHSIQVGRFQVRILFLPLPTPWLVNFWFNPWKLVVGPGDIMGYHGNIPYKVVSPSEICVALHTID